MEYAYLVDVPYISLFKIPYLIVSFYPLKVLDLCVDLQVEMLYQRYFLRTNQSHMVHLLVLLCILFTCMAIAVVLSDYETQVQCSLLLLCCILIYLGKFGSTDYIMYSIYVCTLLLYRRV